MRKLRVFCASAIACVGAQGCTWEDTKAPYKLSVEISTPRGPVGASNIVVGKHKGLDLECCGWMTMGYVTKSVSGEALKIRLNGTSVILVLLTTSSRSDPAIWTEISTDAFEKSVTSGETSENSAQDLTRPTFLYFRDFAKPETMIEIDPTKEFSLDGSVYKLSKFRTEHLEDIGTIETRSDDWPQWIKNCDDAILLKTLPQHSSRITCASFKS